MKRKILTGLAALSLLVCVVSTQGCYDVGYPGDGLRRWIPLRYRHTPTAPIHVDTVGVTGGFDQMDGIMAVDGVMMDTISPVVI